MSAARKASRRPPLTLDRLDITDFVLDEATFARLYTTYQPAVRAFLRKRLDRGTSDLADDLAQDTFFKAWRGRAAFNVSLHTAADPERLLLGWLCTIAQRLVIDHARRDQIIAWVSLDALSERTPHQTAQLLADAGSQARDEGDPHTWLPERLLAQAQTQAALARLTPKYRAVMQLRQRDLTLAEIAARVGCAPGGVKMLSARATAAFRVAYAQEIAQEIAHEDQVTGEEAYR